MVNGQGCVRTCLVGGWVGGWGWVKWDVNEECWECLHILPLTHLAPLFLHQLQEECPLPKDTKVALVAFALTALHRQ